MSSRRSQEFTFHAYGHPNILATHSRTIEITCSDELTTQGDCIVAVAASHSLMELPEKVRHPLTLDSGRGRLVMSVGRKSFSIEGRGADGLTLSDSCEMVARRSGFLSGRTLMIHVDKAALDIPRGMVAAIRNYEQRIHFQLSTWEDDLG